MAKADDHVDVVSDELALDSDVSVDNESWHKIAKNFAFKPSDLKLPKLGLSEFLFRHTCRHEALDSASECGTLPHVPRHQLQF